MIGGQNHVDLRREERDCVIINLKCFADEIRPYPEV